jgi:chorismate mutase
VADLDVHAEWGTADHVTGEGLDTLRARIDRLDETIVVALAARFALSREAGAHKTGSIEDPARETAVIAHVEGIAKEFGLDPDYAAEIYRAVLKMSVQDQLENSSSVRV